MQHAPRPPHPLHACARVRVWRRQMDDFIVASEAVLNRHAGVRKGVGAVYASGQYNVSGVAHAPPSGEVEGGGGTIRCDSPTEACAVTHNLWFQRYRLPRLNTVPRWSLRSTRREAASSALPGRWQPASNPCPSPTRCNPATGDTASSRIPSQRWSTAILPPSPNPHPPAAVSWRWTTSAGKGSTTWRRRATWWGSPL
jgi:hypothetical protein